MTLIAYGSCQEKLRGKKRLGTHILTVKLINNGKKSYQEMPQSQITCQAMAPRAGTNKDTHIKARLQSGLQIRVRIGNYFLYFSPKTYVVGTQKNRLNDSFEYPKTCLN